MIDIKDYINIKNAALTKCMRMTAEQMIATDETDREKIKELVRDLETYLTYFDKKVDFNG